MIKQTVINKWVLVVDDDRDICEAIGDALEAEGIKYIFAYDGSEALSKFNRQEFDLIITDLNMPKANGIKLISQVNKINKAKKLKKDTNFIVISGDLSIFADYLDKLDNVEVLPKPFSLETLIQVVTSLLTGNKKKYVYKHPDELIILADKVIQKVASSIVGKKFKHNSNSVYKKLKLEFDGPYLIHMHYNNELNFGKLIIELDKSFVTTIVAALKMNKKFDADDGFFQLITLITQIFSRTIEKKYINLSIVDTTLTEGFCTLLTSKPVMYKENEDYKIYNLALKKQV
jgi:DNA-binding response OmpR family regulator